MKGRARANEVKAIPGKTGLPESKSIACRHSKRAERGRASWSLNRMLKYEIKKDNFKMSIILYKEVRSIHTSQEVE